MDLYKCTLCAGCQNQCELDHKPVIPEIMEALQRKAVEDGIGPMPTQKVIAQSMRSFPIATASIFQKLGLDFGILGFAILTSMKDLKVLKRIKSDMKVYAWLNS